ncbi:hypothetical protein Anapl_10558 [Anas platyrhynchos]|uniref:Uncharacterized protein n=1 Tax=Anas platyrhynchos TaxID=8839 RepID=R0L7V1_ANAPL|nr:hypothetical protein Anapl_10558 [Anas platyrhynchos]
MVFFPKAYATAARGDFCWQYLSMQAAWCTTSGVILHNHFCKPNVYSKFISDQQLDSKIQLQQLFHVEEAMNSIVNGEGTHEVLVLDSNPSEFGTLKNSQRAAEGIKHSVRLWNISEKPEMAAGGSSGLGVLQDRHTSMSAE